MKGYSRPTPGTACWRRRTRPPDVLAVLRRVATEFAQAPATAGEAALAGHGSRSNVCGDAFGAQLAREVKAYGDLARALDLKTE